MTKSEQARADAMADAETLRIYVLTNPLANRVEFAGVIEASGCAYNIRHCLGDWMPEFVGLANEHWHAAYYATWAARAAFRAVPGLRGGDHENR